MNNAFGKIMRVLAIIFMGITAAMNILGGTGTVCAAFLTENFPSMSAILGHEWIYQILMVLTVGLGLGGVWATILLIRSKEHSYRNALLLLAAGALLGGIHYYTSLTLRGKAVPANMKFYVNVFTLLIFLLLRLPGIRNRVRFTKADGSGEFAGGLTALITGLLVLTTAQWVGASHMSGGTNWVLVLREPLIGVGTALLMLGLGRFAVLASSRKRTPSALRNMGPASK
ncbi:MAG: hypothetical protein JXA97_12880 [Anaerolineales bacterium]|nr:hypothetical protein [Anaerolineales bacterium]